VKNQATNLLEMCIRGGVPIADDMAMFDFVDPQQVKKDAAKGAEESRLLQQRLDVLEWLQEERLENPFGPMRSAYATEDGDEALPFTNVTADFVGHLDYIMFQEQHFKVEGQLYVPKTFGELNGEDIRKGHLLPSNVWPSDHLAIGARLSFVDAECTTSSDDLQNSLGTKEAAAAQKDSENGIQPGPELADAALFCVPLQEGTSAPPPPQIVPIAHGQRCACGCIPKIPSLFEMAELRKQARLKQKY
jgi:hypothetical protein